MLHRDVAQFGSAHVWGAWSRKFKSCHPDHMKQRYAFAYLCFIFFLTVGITRLEGECVKP